MRAKKSLGQHFLINRRAAARIASLLELQPTDQVLEIGGGRGDLTEFLLDSGAEVTCVEIDRELIKYLSTRFSGRDNLRLVRQDILDFEPRELSGTRQGIKLIGNIPYNLSSPIIEWLIRFRDLFPMAVLTVQKEVADRIAASPGGKEFGSLTIFVQLFYEAEKMFLLKPGSFSPAPRVTSAIIRLQRVSLPLVPESEYPDLRRLTAACFRWRRKQLVNILREEYGLDKPTVSKVLETLAIDPATRPERLTVVTFVELARKLRCQTDGSS